jgi:hypothetical protein
MTLQRRLVCSGEKAMRRALSDQMKHEYDRLAQLWPKMAYINGAKLITAEIALPIICATGDIFHERIKQKTRFRIYDRCWRTRAK